MFNTTWNKIQLKYKNIDNSHTSTKYTLQPCPTLSLTKRFDSTHIDVLPNNCLDTALSQQKDGKVVLLNMANENQPGGYPWLIGGQEESLFRNTDLVTRLCKRFYPIKFNQLILTKDVKVIGKKESIDIISAAAPKMEYDFRGKTMPSASAYHMLNGIRHLFFRANQEEYDILILGAWGCGGYRCPPEHVSQLFKMILQEFEGCFKKIIFAIQDIENHPYSNFNVFNRVFLNKIDSIC